MHLLQRLLAHGAGLAWAAQFQHPRPWTIPLAIILIASGPIDASRGAVAEPAVEKNSLGVSAKWEEAIAAFEASDRARPPQKGGVVFVGSSSIRMWKTLAEDFPDENVINRGFGGSEIADAAAFAERIIWPHEPRLVVLYAGGNDLNAGKSPQQVFADFRTFVVKVRERLPEAEIAFISIAGNPARWPQVEKVKAANAMMERFAREDPRVKFIDVFPHMLGSDGLPRPEIFSPDQLHMNAEGYKLWTKIVRPFLKAR